MLNPGLTVEQMREAVDAYRSFSNQIEAASFLGISRGALQNRLRQAAEVGLDGILTFKDPLSGSMVCTTAIGEGGKSSLKKRKASG